MTKTAEGAKANVAQQVQLGLLDVNQKQCSCDYHSVQCAVNEMDFQIIFWQHCMPLCNITKSKYVAICICRK